MPPEFVDAFVCPVILTENVLHSPIAMELGVEGHYTISGPTLHNGVPVHATNDDGLGAPEGPQAAPGDTTYTAIWDLTPV
jgi:hypothetical protein